LPHLISQHASIALKGACAPAWPGDRGARAEAQGYVARGRQVAVFAEAGRRSGKMIGIGFDGPPDERELAGRSRSSRR
jgi:hypothetical protein